MIMIPYARGLDQFLEADLEVTCDLEIRFDDAASGAGITVFEHHGVWPADEDRLNPALTSQSYVS